MLPPGTGVLGGMAFQPAPSSGYSGVTSDLASGQTQLASSIGMRTQPMAYPPHQPTVTTGAYSEPFATEPSMAYGAPAPANQTSMRYGGSYGYGAPSYYPPPTPSSRTPRTAISAYGGYTLDSLQGTPGLGCGNSFFQPTDWAQAAQQQQELPEQLRTMQSTPATNGSTTQDAEQPLAASGHGYDQGGFGMPSSIKNAVRMIQPFYSDGSTVEKALSFWDSFERATVGLTDTVRLSAFRECLKGKTGENWWMYSQIQDFETLRRRFHNQFICQTPLQMIERLKSTRRSRGMSAEVWGDQISSLCDAAQCYDPQMRYQYFLSGLRNSEWKAALTTTMVTTIPQAVMVLLYKNMHIPVEDDSDFADEVATKPATENTLMQQMMAMMQQTQNLLVQQQQQMARSPRSPRKSNPQGFADAAYEDPFLSICAATENEPSKAGTGRRMGPDDYTREGISVCGRCHYKGCRRDTCRYNNMTCNNCRERGHVAFECDKPRRQSGPRQNAGGGNGNQSSAGRGCFFCSRPDHRIADCPVRRTVLQMADQAAGAAPVQGPTPAQNGWGQEEGNECVAPSSCLRDDTVRGAPLAAWVAASEGGEVSGLNGVVDAAPWTSETTVNAEKLIVNERSYEEPLSGWDGAEREECNAAAATMAYPAGPGDWVISIEEECEEERSTDAGVGQIGSVPEKTLASADNATKETSPALNGPAGAAADDVEASGLEEDEKVAEATNEEVAVATSEDVAVATDEEVAEATTAGAVRTDRTVELLDEADEKPVMSEETVRKEPSAVDHRDERCASAQSATLRGDWARPGISQGDFWPEGELNG
jgi:hypothetical protein